MASHFDHLETQSAEARDADLMARLPAHVARAQSQSPHYAETLAGIDAAMVNSRAALARLPVVRKHQLLALQKRRPPLGGLAATPVSELAHVFASPGPIADPEGRGEDWWRFARAMHAAGIRAGDLVHNTFSYHFTPAGSMMETAAHALGCTVFPAGVGQTEQQVAAMADLRPDAYAGTPSFLRIILDKAEELGVKLDCLKKAFVSGEAFPPSQRDALAAHGIQAYQAYATADIGLIAFETPAREGLVVDEDVLLEIVRPGTGDPVPAG